MTHLIAKISKTEEIQKKLFLVLLGLVLVVFSFYLYFLNATISEAVAKKMAINEMRELGAEYQQLEEEYFALINEFDLDYARELGLVEQKNIAYITRTTQTAMAR